MRIPKSALAAILATMRPRINPSSWSNERQ